MKIITILSNPIIIVIPINKAITMAISFMEMPLQDYSYLINGKTNFASLLKEFKTISLL